MKTYIFPIALFLSMVSCQKNDHLPDSDKYVYDIPQVDLQADARVGAYYHHYTTADWDKLQTDVSLLGKPYDVLADASVFPRQLDWAGQAGVDFLIFKWNATATDDALLDAFAQANGNKPIGMVIAFNTAHLNASNTTKLEGPLLEQMLDEFSSLIATYVSKDYYYRIEGRPVIILSPLNLAASRAESIDFVMVTDRIRQHFSTYGLDPFIIGEITTGWTAPANFRLGVLAAMDGVVATTWNTADYDRWWAFYSFSDLNWQNWKASLAPLGVDYVPCIFPGYDEPAAPTQRAIERTEKNYIDYANVAKRSMGRQRIVFVNSWNDFVRGTALEPSEKYPQQFLELTRRAFKLN